MIEREGKIAPPIFTVQSILDGFESFRNRKIHQENFKQRLVSIMNPSGDVCNFDFDLEFVDFGLNWDPRDPKVRSMARLLEGNVSDSTTAPVCDSPSVNKKKPQPEKIVGKKRSKRDSPETATPKVISNPEPLLPAATQTTSQTPMMMRFMLASTLHQPKLNSIYSFPADVMSCLNSANFTALSCLTQTHLDPNCEITVSYTHQKLSCQKFLKLFELLNEIHPDRIMCSQKCETQGNRVSGQAFLKFTDSKPLYDSVAWRVNDPALSTFFPPCRADILKRKMRPYNLPEPARRQLVALLESDQDLVIYGSIDVVLDINPITHKGVRLHLECQYQSVHPANMNTF